MVVCQWGGKARTRTQKAAATTTTITIKRGQGEGRGIVIIIIIIIGNLFVCLLFYLDGRGKKELLSMHASLGKNGV